jgi:hypothetical protein
MRALSGRCAQLRLLGCNLFLNPRNGSADGFGRRAVAFAKGSVEQAIGAMPPSMRGF